MSGFKHFSLSERIVIEHSLKDLLSFKAIGRDLNKDCTSISKEVRKHLYRNKVGSYGRGFNDCADRFNCSRSYICEDPGCKHSYCRFCSRCHLVCSDYRKQDCHVLTKPPYVCNGCGKLKSCTLEKSLYSAAAAQKEYESFLSESRSGISADEKEIARLDGFISPLIRNGQSLHHICSSNKDVVMHSEKTIYNYTGYSLFAAKNIDLPRKVRYRPRKSSANHFKVDRSCRIGRTYDDFIAFTKAYPDISVVEMDTVEGTKGGKVLLTIHFTTASFMLAFIRDANTSQSVIDIFDMLYSRLGATLFAHVFPVILGDRGSEFSNPSAIEFDREGNRRTYVFYCDPSKPYQKPEIENNHELIRRIVPKGFSLDSYNQEDIRLMMNHINSYARKKLNNKSPHQVFSFLHEADVLKALDASLISPNEIILKPKLLEK